MRTSSNIPNQVRATDLVLDEGRVFAMPGDVGEVLDAETYEGGMRVVMVQFSGAPAVTTCILGGDVEALLAAVPYSASAANQMPDLITEPAPERARRRWMPRVAAALAAVFAGVVWCAAGGQSTTAELKGPIAESMPGEALAADIARTLDGLLFAGRLPEKFPEHWKRKPCDGRQVMVNGACFLVLEQRPPCSDGYAHEGLCIVPVAASAPTNQSIRRE